MAQSTDSSDSSLRGIPASRPSPNVEQPTQQTNWIDQIHLAIIAKENWEIDNLKEPMESGTTIPISEATQGSENETQRKTREARNEEVI